MSLLVNCTNRKSIDNARRRLLLSPRWTVFHWDGMVIRHLSKRVSVGAIGSNVTQITPDQGPLADELHGFQGGCWGAGPIVTYVAKVAKPEVHLDLRWVNQFTVTNLLKGNAFMFGLTLKLD